MSIRSTTFLGLALFGLQLGCGQAHAVITAHYSFDTNFNDVSGNGRHGVAVDGNGNASTAGVSITNTPGEFVFGGGAANFTTERDYIDIPLQTFASGNPYSVSFWARDLSGTGNNGGMVIGQAGNTNFFIWITNDATLGLRWRSADSSAARQADFTVPGSTANDMGWHHYAVIASDADGDLVVDDISLYVDGVFIGTDLNNNTGFNFDDIGEAYSTALDVDFFGQIDEVFIFNNAITAADVSNLFNFNSLTAPVIPEPATMALFSMMGMIGLTRGRNRRIA